LGPIPNPQSPIPINNRFSTLLINKKYKLILVVISKNK
jgi:hypothetical protein